MKLNAILTIYDMLLGGDVIHREEICARCKITERTFYRYLKELNAYLRTKHKKVALVSVGKGGYRFEKITEPIATEVTEDGEPNGSESTEVSESAELDETETSESETAQPNDGEVAVHFEIGKTEPVSITASEVAVTTAESKQKGRKVTKSSKAKTAKTSKAKTAKTSKEKSTKKQHHSKNLV